MDSPVGGGRPGPVFVGREREVAEMEQALEASIAGRGGLLLVAGEAGVGKTRLAEEVGARAAARGCRVLWGRCWEGEGAPSFWPWVQILRACVNDAGRGALEACAPAELDHVAELVPELRRRLPGSVRTPLPADSEEARFARFDAVSRFLGHAARERALLLVLDDVHWADRPSLLLLEFLAQGLSTLPILALATLREPHGGDTQLDSAMLARLVRLGRHLSLRGLSEPELGRFVEQAGDAKALPSFVAALHGATNGNPFFVVEVLRLLAAESAEAQLEHAVTESFPIPQSVRAAIRRRVSLLPERARSMLTVAAVIGRDFEVPLLERAWERPATEVLALLGLGLESGIVVRGRVAATSYAFSHGLVRETLYDDLDPAVRAAAHRRVAESLESLHAGRVEPHLAELARHFGEAVAGGGDAAKAIDYSRRAGERAAAMLAYEEAVQHLERALACHDGSGAADDRARCRLLMGLAEALWNAGVFERAVATYTEAAAAASRLGDPVTLGRATLGMAGDLGYPGTFVDPTLIAFLKAALASLPEGDGELRVRLMVRLALAVAFTSERERIPSLLSEATAMARRVGEPRALFQTLEHTHWLTWGPDDLDGRLARVDEIIRLGEERDSARSSVAGRHWKVSHLLEAGDADGAVREFRHLQNRSRRVRSPYRRSLVLGVEVLLAHLDGLLDEAERLAYQGMTLAGAANAAQAFTAQIGLVRRERGELGEFAGAVEAVTSANPDLVAWRVGLAWLNAELGRADEVRRALDVFDRNGLQNLPRDWTWFGVMWGLAQAVTFVGDAARAELLYDLLLPYADRCAVFGTIVFLGSIARTLGNLAATRGRFDQTEHHFEAALERDRAMGARLWVAWTEHDFARMLAARGRPGDRDRALALVDQALASARELGMKALEKRASALRAELGPEVAPAPEAELLRVAGGWTIRYGGDAFFLNARGLQYLAHLLRHPRQEIHVADLAAAGGEETRADLGHAGEILDARARSDYRTRLEEARGEHEEAARSGDADRADRLQAEIEFLTGELSAAYGLGGRARRGGDVAERVRKAVTKTIRAAIEQIEAHAPALASHLSGAIRTGKLCVYDPAEELRWKL